MAACDPMQFENVNLNTFNGLKSKLQSFGYTLEGTSGTLRGPMGIVIEYRWDEQGNTLYANVKDKNFFVPCSRIRAELEKAVAECR